MNGKATSVLIVDDRPENRFAMKSVLRDLDIEIVMAESGEQALSSMLRHSFAVVLLDVQMPGMNGFETAELMRAYDETRKTPIIFVTAISKEEQHIFRGYEAGAVDYIFKPVNPLILRSKVSVFLELAGQRQALAGTVAELEQTNEDLERFAHALRGLVEKPGTGVVPDEGRSLIHPDEMARRLHQFLASRSHCQDPDGPADERSQDDATANCVQFQGRQYALSESKGSLLQVLLSSMEDVIEMAREVERVHTQLRHEIAERRRAEEAYRVASQAKSRFLGHISHELRTPLNGIIGLSEIALATLNRESADASLAEQLSLIHESGRFLSQLVDKLMTRSLLEVDRMKLESEQVDLFSLIRNTSNTLEPVARKRGNQLRYDCDAGIGQMTTDGIKLREILHNLVGNACKFTRDGDIQLSAARESLDGVDVIVFRVRDTGIGIPHDQQETIFEDFKQLDETTTRHHQGVGLGLSICRHYCRLMGGTIEVASTPGQGSLFTVTLRA